MSKNIIDFYREYKKTTFDQVRVQKHCKFLPERGARILDAGCGAGEMSVHYKRLGNVVDGMEINPELATHAAERLNKVWCHDLQEPWPMEDNTYDWVVLSAVLEHVFHLDFVIKETYRVLRNSGRLLIDVPNVAYLPNRLLLLFGRPLIWIGTGKHIRAFVKGNLEGLLRRNGFKPLHFEGSILGVPGTRQRLRIPLIDKVFPGLCWTLICVAIREQR